MAISFVASSRAPAWTGSSNNTSSVSCAKPTGVANGDVMIAYCQSGGGATHTAPTGWTLLSNYQNTGSLLTSSIFYKVASSEGSSYSFSDDLGDLTPMCVQIVAYRGVDTTSSPVDVHTEANTGGTNTASAPSATSTAVGRYVWFRTGKTGTVSPEGDFTITGGTPRQKSSNRGGSTAYFVESADSNGELGVGAHTGASFASSLSLSGSIERTIVLKTLADPASGGFASTLSPVVASFAATRQIPAGPIGVTLPKASFDGAGRAAPPSGSLGTLLPSLESSVGATSAVGGGIDSTLPHPVVAGVAGAVVPTGSASAGLPRITSVFEGETRPHGENVIIVEDEKRAFRITQDDMTDIYARQVSLFFGGVVGINKYTLPKLQCLMLSTGGIPGQVTTDLPSVTSEFDGAMEPLATLNTHLPRVSADLAGTSDAVQGGPVGMTLPSLNPDFEGFNDVIWVGNGDFSSGTSDLTVNLPSNRLPGDVWLLIVESGPSDTVSAPSGWTEVASSPQTTSAGSQDTKLSVFWTVVTGSETAPVISFSGDHIGAQIHGFRGCDVSGTDPIDVEGGSANSVSDTLVTMPSISTQGRGEMVVYIGSHGIDSASPQASLDSNVGALDNLTERADNGFTDGAGGGFFVYTGNCPSPRFVGSGTFDLAASSPRAAITLALLALTGAGPVGGDDLLKFVTDIGDGTSTSYTVSHNFGSRDVSVTVYDNTTFQEVEADITHSTLNTVTVGFTSAPASLSYRVVVLYSSV